MREHLHIVSSGYTSRGKRSVNEDSFAADDRYGIYIVADGMGGARCGETASRVLAAEVMDYITRSLSQIQSAESASRIVEKAIQEANASINAIALGDEEHQGMGTTAVVCLILRGVLHVGWVGDSRAYLVHDGRLTRLTRDHSLVQHLVDEGAISEEQSRHHPERHVITRAVGVDAEVEVDMARAQIEYGDMVLLCSDGIHGILDDNFIGSIMTMPGDIAAKSRALVERALEKGSDDNATALVCVVRDNERHSLIK